MPRPRRVTVTTPATDTGARARAPSEMSDRSDLEVATPGESKSQRGTAGPHESESHVRGAEPVINNSSNTKAEPRKRQRSGPHPEDTQRHQASASGEGQIQSTTSNSSLAACDQCRSRKVRCDRQQPECSNCRKAGILCNQTNNVKRINHTKQLCVFNFPSFYSGRRIPSTFMLP